MSLDITFHYPPELFNLLVDAVPLMNRSKKDVVLFFRGAGVEDAVLADFVERLKRAHADINNTKSSEQRWSGSTDAARLR